MNSTKVSTTMKVCFRGMKLKTKACHQGSIDDFGLCEHLMGKLEYDLTLGILKNRSGMTPAEPLFHG